MTTNENNWTHTREVIGSQRMLHMIHFVSIVILFKQRIKKQMSCSVEIMFRYQKQVHSARLDVAELHKTSQVRFSILHFYTYIFPSVEGGSAALYWATD